MSDARLRELERRFRETGAPDDEAAWLAERVRAGDLTSERLELAAFLGHPAALLAAADPPKPARFVSSWVRDMHRWGVQAPLRAAVAAQELLLNGQADPPLPADWRAVQEGVLRRVRAWLECPCPDHLTKALRDDGSGMSSELLEVLATEARIGAERPDVAGHEGGRHGEVLVGHVLGRLSAAAVKARLGARPRLPDDVSVYGQPRHATRAATPEEQAARDAYDARERKIQDRVEEQLRRLIAQAMLPWVLGTPA